MTKSSLKDYTALKCGLSEAEHWNGRKETRCAAEMNVFRCTQKKGHVGLHHASMGYSYGCALVWTQNGEILWENSLRKKA